MLEGKLTLPALYVLNTTTDAWAQEMALRVKAGTATVDEITRLIEFIKQNGGIEYAVKVMYEYKERALDLLRTLPDSAVKTSLITYWIMWSIVINKFLIYFSVLFSMDCLGSLWPDGKDGCIVPASFFSSFHCLS